MYLWCGSDSGSFWGEFFSFYVSNSIVFRNFVMDLSVFNGWNPDIMVKYKAFAIISRLAKSLGNSFGIKSTNNMWQVTRIVIPVVSKAMHTQ